MFEFFIVVGFGALLLAGAGICRLWQAIRTSIENRKIIKLINANKVCTINFN